jgi:predicted nucleotidyltransferase component of viral defense system
MKSGNTKSIQATLKNLADNKNVQFQLIITRYLYERLLYRLSVSKYRDKFCLKGGVLLYVFEKEFPRPTLDIDFLGIKIKNDVDNIKNVFHEILTIDYEDDGVEFDTETIETEEITENKAYQGIRVTYTARLGSIRQTMKIDIGFGDVITPNAQSLFYPVLMEELPGPDILAYSLETVVAEKFQAMIDLSEINSRYKDFYDVYKVITMNILDEKILVEAIQATFQNRKTFYQSKHSLFTDDFAKDKNRNTQWKRFLHKIKQDETLNFETVMGVIKVKLQPVFETLKEILIWNE